MESLLAAKKIILLDGGLSNELNTRVSFDIHSEPLWTAKALQSDPKAVTETHLEYLKGEFVKLFSFSGLIVLLR
jgi:S-methylmethionine-dependent homocysteine/selenocysteine methylase